MALSVAMSFATDASLANGSPRSFSRAAASIVAREDAKAASMSASRNARPWCSMIGWPKVSRSCA